MRHLHTVPLIAVALAACSPIGSEQAALGGGGDAGVCEPTWTTTLDTTTGVREVVGAVVFTIDATEVRAEITAAAGWDLGDAYLGVGRGGMAPEWVYANSEPWVTGWLDHIVIKFPLEELMCGEELKIQLQVNVRREGEPYPVLASAAGEQDRGEWGWATFRPVCCDVPPPPGEGCTLTQGYWKNHEDAWPVDSLVIGGVSYDQDELLALLWTPVRGDGSISLAHQLIAALLNVESGASPVDAIADAQAWMAANADADGRLPYGTHPRLTSSLNDALAAFNEGEGGVRHCDDEPGPVVVEDAYDAVD